MEQATVSDSGAVSHGTDAKLWVEFYTQAVKQGFESEKQGRPIFKDTDYVKVMIPGDKFSQIVREASQDDKDRWPRQWAAYQNKAPAALEGTPLKEWPPLSVSRVAELATFNIYTVEQLAALHDGFIEKIGMGGRELVRQAATWLKSAADGAHSLKLQAELDKRDITIADLQRQITELAGRLGPKGKAA